MVFPIGEYLIFSLGLFALVEGFTQRSIRPWGALGFVWLVGLVLENNILWDTPWHWHFSRLFVVALFAGLAWRQTQGSKLLPAFITALTLAGENLFYVNEPGMFKLDQWVFGGIVLFVSYLSTKDLWGMGFALAGGILLDLGISVFLFQGVVRHYDLPDSFLWHLSVTFLTSGFAIRAFRQFHRAGASMNSAEDRNFSTTESENEGLEYSKQD